MDNLVEIILQAIDNASGVFGDVSNAAEEMDESIQGVSGASIEGVSGDADDLEREILETDDAINQMNDDLGIINSSMLMQLGEQVGQLGSSAESMAQDMNEASISVGQLATQTGIAEPQMVSMINTISNATFPNEEAMMYVKSLDQMGVSAENLGTSATNLDKINDAFQLGASTTNSLGQELGVLGVDMNNVSTAFNALAYANSNTVGGMQNYFTFLRRYDSQFKELGYDVDQSSIIIAAATQKYGGGKAALSGLSTALKEADGDTRKLEEALGIQAGTLDNASSVTGEYEGQLQALADEEMEHKTILDQIGAAWEDVSLSLGSTMSPLMGVVGAFGQLGSFGLQVKGLKELATTFTGIRTALAELNIVQAITTGEFWSMAAAELAAAWPILAIVAAIALITAAVYELGIAMGWWDDFGGMIDAFYNNILVPIYNFLVSVFTPAWNFLGQVFNAIVPYITVLANAFTSFLNGQMSLPDAILAIMTSVFQIYTTIFNMVITALVRFGSQMLSRGMASATRFVNGIVTRIRQLPGRVYSALMGVVSRISSAIQSWITTASSKVQSLISSITSPFSGVAGAISGALSGVVSAITGPFERAWEKIKPLVEKIQQGMDLIGARGGEEAEGRQSLLTNAGSYSVDNRPVTVDHNLNISLDLRNVPQGVDTDTLIGALTDRRVLNELVNNSDFQLLDGKAKERLNLKIGRARGV